MSKIYDWKRFWYRQGDSPHIIDGFLYVHEYTKNVFNLDVVSNVPCLVLLSEPGMGKSKELERIYQSQTLDENNDKVYFSLSSFGDESRLIKEIFESDKIKQWRTDNTNLYLCLDSLDEALLSINTLALLLADELGKITFKDRRKNVKEIEDEKERRKVKVRLPLKRLFFRIACRTSEWSNLSVLENKLREIWEDDKCQILQIAPLQQKDVEIAAQDENLDSKRLLAEIYNRSVTALASKPVTLQFLLALFGKNNSLPSTQTELYEKGCLALCEEKNQSRKASKRVGKLTRERRFTIAARIAALIIYGNKSSIWIGGITGEEEDSDILINEISGFTEREKDNAEFQVTDEEILEVISDTSLFTGNGNNRLKFSHQTFAEFLASWYLQYKELSDEAVIKIIGEEYLYPQLYETSAWIANQRHGVFQHLMKVAPAILLRSDVLLAKDPTKEKLVNILLNLFDKEESKGIDRNYYRKLSHPKLAEQLKPYITDKTKGWLVRSEAIDIAEVCDVKELQNDLVNITLDKADTHNIRVNAAYAVAQIGDSETKAKLKPLIFGKEEDDERFMLKGVALRSLWNEQLTAQELFSVLSPPSNFFTGSYEVFFRYEMVEKLKIEDLPIALDWLIENIGTFVHSISSERRVADEILLRAWDNLERQEVFERFIKVVIKLISNLEDIFKEIENEEKLNEITQENGKRRKVWLELFSSIGDDSYWLLEGSKFFGLKSDDISWLVQEWQKTEDENLKVKLLSRLKSFVFYLETHPNALDEICKSCDENEDLKKEFEEIFAPIELNSEKAKQQKEFYYESTKWKREREEKRKEGEKPISPSPIERTLECIEKFENGEIDAFWHSIYWLRFFPNGRTEISDFEANITIFPVWKDADENTKSRIIKAARQYLEKGNPENEKWVGTKSFQYSALAGYRAIVLLERIEPEFIKKLSKTIWEKWVAIVYYYPVFNGSGNDEYERHRQLITKTYKIVPEKIIELIKQDIESKSEESYWSFEKLKYCWDDRLKNVLKETLNNTDLPVSVTRNILSQLFELKDTEVGKLACDLIKFPIPQNNREQELLIIAVELLIKYGKISCWEKIWQILENDVEFGKRIIESGVCRFGRLAFQDFSEKQISDLYIWLSEQYLHKEDPVHYGVYSPSARDEIVRWRDSLLGVLKENGTIKSVNEIKRIRTQLPHLEWLKFTLLDAEEKMRATSWQPLSTQELLKVFCSDKEQKVEVEKAKLDLILERLERKLDLLSSKVDENPEQTKERFANLAMEQVQKELSRFSKEEREEFEEAKKGRWETKLKFVIPLIPQIPFLGELLPSAVIETTRTIEPDEYIDFVQRKLYGEGLQTNILQEESEARGLLDIKN